MLAYQIIGGGIAALLWGYLFVLVARDYRKYVRRKAAAPAKVKIPPRLHY